MSDETAITVTEAARNFADCVNRVHYQNQSFILLKNGVPFARLVPVERPGGRGADVAAALRSVELSEVERRAWAQDLKMARRHLRPPRDRWK